MSSDSARPGHPIWGFPGHQPLAAAPVPPHPAFQRILGQLQARLLSSFSTEQLRNLPIAYLPSLLPHLVHYRASIRLFGPRHASISRLILGASAADRSDFTPRDSLELADSRSPTARWL
jgi:hypothetical protein